MIEYSALILRGTTEQGLTLVRQLLQATADSLDWLNFGHAILKRVLVDPSLWMI
jgi:hypothetical protein